MPVGHPGGDPKAAVKLGEVVRILDPGSQARRYVWKSSALKVTALAETPYRVNG